MVDRFADFRERVERAAEELLLPHPVDAGDDDNQAGVQRLRRKRPVSPAWVAS
ncbi:MAG TPA: hypothetical protein VFN42_05015 [Acetobacteraceae bacterium]|nr:hypothetical protein [Acetobacteraceae bacterium]